MGGVSAVVVSEAVEDGHRSMEGVSSVVTLETVLVVGDCWLEDDVPAVEEVDCLMRAAMVACFEVAGEGPQVGGRDAAGVEAACGVGGRA